jgi:hypothetical protein
MVRFTLLCLASVTIATTVQAASVDGKWKLNGGCPDGREFRGSMTVKATTNDASGTIKAGPLSGTIVGGGRDGELWTFVVQPPNSPYVDVWRASDNAEYRFFMAAVETGEQVCQVYATR